jgi:hypothetical protein
VPASSTRVVVLLLILCTAPRIAFAQADDELPGVATPPATAPQPAPAPRPLAIEYSDGYELRRKIHVYASVATAPLFVAQYVVGKKLFDGHTSESMQTAHTALAAGIGALFAVNTVTGVWNLWEGRKDPNRRTRRLIHGLSMIGADVGFVATAMTAPEHIEGPRTHSTHRTVAITSVAIASASYVYMLLTR